MSKLGQTFRALGDSRRRAVLSCVQEHRTVTLSDLAERVAEDERDAPLVYRLLTALAAGERAGGDGRDLPVGSAAAVVSTAAEPEPLYHDLRVDASETPVADLRETYRQAKRGYEAAVDRYQTENS